MKAEELLYEMAMTGLEGDRNKFRNLAIAVAQYMKKSSPDKSYKLAEAISQTNVGKSPFRAAGFEPVPSDQDSNLEILASIEFPSQDAPILNSATMNKIDDFIAEYSSAANLLSEGIKPPTSLIFTGPPGVGKTMLAHYVANKTEKKLYVLNLATVVSSYLGKTSQNLKAALDFAKQNDAIIFLDEFDSIAKKRNDSTDLGELKRIVNVLLLELENWPPNSIIIAATNHPELIDVAIWRRFDASVEISLPDSDTVKKILVKYCPEMKKYKGLLPLYVGIFTGSSPAEIRKVLNKAKRQSIIKDMSIQDALMLTAKESIHHFDKKAKKSLCLQIRNIDPDITLDEIGELVGLAASTVHYHINNPTKELE